MLKKGQDPSGVPLTGNDRFEGTVKIIYAYEFSSPYRNYARSRCKSRAIQSARMCCRTDLLHTTQQVRSTIYTAWAKDMSVLQISAMCDCSAFFFSFFSSFSERVPKYRPGPAWCFLSSHARDYIFNGDLSLHEGDYAGGLEELFSICTFY